MQLDFTSDQIAKLSEIASHEGTNAEQLVKDAALRVMEDNDRYLAAVEEGIDQANRGSFVEHDAVRSRINRILQQ
jgi:predicted transcriptional regulator